MNAIEGEGANSISSDHGEVTAAMACRVIFGMICDHICNPDACWA
jgi:hypothetical protein